MTPSHAERGAESGHLVGCAGVRAPRWSPPDRLNAHVVTSSAGHRLAIAGPPWRSSTCRLGYNLAHCRAAIPGDRVVRDTPALIEDMVETGVKSGSGFYMWDDESVTDAQAACREALSTIDQLS